MKFPDEQEGRGYLVASSLPSSQSFPYPSNHRFAFDSSETNHGMERVGEAG